MFFNTIFASFAKLLSAHFAFAQSTQAVADFSVWTAMSSASWPVQMTFALLVFMSVASWAIIFTKKRALDLVQKSNAPFLDVFWRAGSLEDIFAQVDQYPDSTLARVFRAGFLELRKLAENSKTASASGAPLLSGIDNIERVLSKTINIELTRLESRMSFLATTGSTGPFIGLFGTVWGIMGAFHKIGATNMANLAIVAPGISEALIATAVGLAAAIPATVAYNHYLTRIKKEEIAMNGFASDFMNIIKRHFFKDA